MSTPFAYSDIIEIDSKMNYQSNIPEQLRDYSIAQGVSINLLVIGKKGVGARTLLNNLFMINLIPDDRSDLCSFYGNLFEGNIGLKLSVTTMYEIDKEKIIATIQNLYKEHFENEKKIRMCTIDSRFTAVFYLISDLSLERKEIEILREIGKISNLIPIITKRDCYTDLELFKKKSYLMDLFSKEEINMYMPFDTDISIRSQVPLATIASEDSVEVDGNMEFARRYPWADVFVNDSNISDFIYLRYILLHSHLDDLLAKTDEFYFVQKLNFIKADLADAGERRRYTYCQEIELLRQTEQNSTQAVQE